MFGINHCVYTNYIFFSTTFTSEEYPINGIRQRLERGLNQDD